MTSLRILIALATIVILGGGLVGILWRGTEKPSPPEWFGWAWVLGTAGVSGLLMVLGIAIPKSALLPTVLAVCLGIGVWGHMRQKQLKSSIWLHNAQRWELVSLFGALSLVALAGIVTTLRPLRWDGIILWEFKARAAFLSGGTLSADFFRDPTRLWTHPNYPLSFPFTELWIYLWIGDCDQAAVQWLAPFFLAAGSALVLATVVRITGRLWPGVLSIVVLVLLPNFALGSSLLAAGYVDFPLAVAYTATLSAILFEEKSCGMEPQWAIAAASGAACIWLKAEGVFLWGTSILVAFCYTDTRQWRRILWLAASGAAVLLAWKFMMMWINVPAATTFQPVTIENLVKNLPRIAYTLNFMGAQLIALPKFSILWPLVAVALIELWLLRRREALALTVAIAVPLALDIVPYVFTSYDLKWHLRTSCSRLILQLTPIGLIALGLAVGHRYRHHLDISSTRPIDLQAE